MFCQNLLLVDDEEILLRVLEGLLKPEPYKIFMALNAREALEIVHSHPISVVIADQRMPGMSGSDFLDQVRKHSPETVRVILSGFEDLNLTMDVLYQGRIYMYLKKPWEENPMKESIRRCSLQYEINQMDSLKEQCSVTPFGEHAIEDGLLLSNGEELNPALGFYTEVLSQLPCPGAVVDAEGQLLFFNQASRKMFSSCKSVDQVTPVWELLMPSLTIPLQTFLDSDQLNEKFQLEAGNFHWDRITDQQGSNLAVCMRYYPQRAVLES